MREKIIFITKNLFYDQGQKTFLFIKKTTATFEQT